MTANSTPPGGPITALRRLSRRDHTRGSLLTSLFALALPMIATSGLFLVFQVVDLAFIAQLGDAPMASVIIVNQVLRQIVMMMIMGLSFGSQALIARAVGEGRVDRAEHLAGQVVFLGAVFSAAVATIGLSVPGFLFSLAGADPSFDVYGIPYLRLVYAFTFGMAGMQLFAAILGGAGDTTTPFLVITLQVAVGILAEWVLIFGHLGAPALGVEGVALGIALGNGIGMVVGMLVLFRGRSRVHIRRRHLRPDPAAIRTLLQLSWPPAVQMGAQSIVVAIFLRLADDFGESVQTAYAIGLRLGMIVPMVCFPLAGACATLVGQALGSGNVPRAWQALRIGLQVHCSIMWTLALGLFFFRTQLMRLLSDDPTVVEIGAEYILYLSGAAFFWGFYFVFFRSLQGAGDMRVPMLISVGSTFLVSLPLAFFLTQYTDVGRQGLWIAILVSTAVTTLGTGARIASGQWTHRPLATVGGSKP
ncbi:MAG: MATE family efflux transporter [Myxococcota bacterium]|nr:MATE family efflux transporter [Myxococcota bacterium]